MDNPREIGLYGVNFGQENSLLNIYVRRCNNETICKTEKEITDYLKENDFILMFNYNQQSYRQEEYGDGFMQKYTKFDSLTIRNIDSIQ